MVSAAALEMFASGAYASMTPYKLLLRLRAAHTASLHALVHRDDIEAICLSSWQGLETAVLDQDPTVCREVLLQSHNRGFIPNMTSGKVDEAFVADFIIMARWVA